MPLTRMNAISIVLTSIRDHVYTQRILLDGVTKDKTATINIFRVEN